VQEIGLGTGLGLVGGGLPFMGSFLPVLGQHHESNELESPQRVMESQMKGRDYGKSEESDHATDPSNLNDFDSDNEPGEPGQQYICHLEDCQKAFPDHGSLRKHQMTHGERMFTCPVEGCRKKFLDNSKLKRHQLVHTGEKPYKCDICKKCFSLDFNLRTHLRTHTGEKPYICSFA
jgi:transcription factor YY